MTKTQLISDVAKNANLKKSDVEAIVEAFLDTVMDEVAKGERIQITGFGTFERRERGERVMKNPRTGEDMQVGASKSPAFSAGSAFRAKVNG